MFSYHVYRAEVDMAAAEAALAQPGDLPVPAVAVPTEIEKTGVFDILRAARTDVEQSPDKARTLGSAALVLGVGAAGFSKLPLIAASQGTLAVLEQTQNSVATGLAAATMFGVWNRIVSKVYDNGMGNFPSAIRTIKESFPGSSNTLSNSLPGFNDANQEFDTPKKSLIKRLGRRASTHIRRGATVEGVGIAPYIFAAHTQEQSPKEISKLSNTASIDGGVVAGTLAGIAAEAIIRVGDKNPQFAENLQETAGDSKVLLSAAVSLMLWEFISNRRRRKNTGHA
jgi:hypothetical protein